MLSKHRLGDALLLCLVAATLAGPLHAAVVHYEHTDYRETDDYDALVLMPGFDDSLGTLDSVTLDIEATYTFEVGYYFRRDPAPGPLPYHEAAITIEEAYAGDIDITREGTVVDGYGISYFDCRCSGSVTATATVDLALTIDDPLEMAAFQDDFYVSIFAYDDYNKSSRSGSSYDYWDSTVSENFRVSYDYTVPAVPLPAGLPLLAAGLAVLGIARRRRGHA